MKEQTRMAPGMTENSLAQDWFNWRLPLYSVLTALILFVPAALWNPDLYLLGFVIAGAIIGIVLIGYAVIKAFAKKLRECLLILLMFVIYGATSALLIANQNAIRTTARWLIWSNYYKARVLAEAPATNGELKHIEWDGWGFAGMDTSVYVVFDPTDSLSVAAKNRQSGKYSGIPCPVDIVRRLESHWYSVQFYTDESWGQCK
jgi:energy-coupling factor transporter transmembrane protein EcfT